MKIISHKTLDACRQAFLSTRVLVVGDTMLDRYWFGEVDRISPEAPVPVVRVSRSEERLGGAANVARNITALGATATLMSVVGKDDAAVSVERLLGEAGVSTRLMVDASVPTIVKLRIVGRQQQLIRADFESLPNHDRLLDQLSIFNTLLDNHDIVILSDYGKGGLHHIKKMIQLARDKQKQVIIDPKGDDYERYRFATAITPNKAELRQVVGSWQTEEDLQQKVCKLRSELDIQSVLLTRSEEGMSLFSTEHIFHEPTVAREVFDVSGAGDTVIGVFSTAIAAGCGWVDAMQIANAAAGIVVAKLGTATASWEELEESLFKSAG